MVVWEALDALSHEFELCKIDSSTRLVALIEPDCAPDRVSLIRAALARSGAQAVEVRYLASGVGAEASPFLADVVRSADVLIATSDAGLDQLQLLRTDDQQLLHLSDLQPHMFAPHANLRRRARSLVEQVRSGSEIVLEDAYGTSLRIDLTGSNSAFDHGFIGGDRQIASFPAGWVSATPAAGTVSGQLVLMPGDANLAASRLISSPVRMKLLDDHVSQIQGASADADVVRALFEYADDASAYGFAEISIGLNPGAAPTSVFDERLLDSTISRLLAGVVTLSFGENLLADRPCAQTVTLALPGRSVEIDGLPITIAGDLQGDFAPDVYEL